MYYVNIFIVKCFLTHCVCANALKLAIKVGGLHIFVSQHLWFCHMQNVCGVSCLFPSNAKEKGVCGY